MTTVDLQRIEPRNLFMTEGRPNDVFMCVRHETDWSIVVRRFTKVRRQWQSVPEAPEELFRHGYWTVTPVDAVTVITPVEVHDEPSAA